jgi:hypothetical protein
MATPIKETVVMELAPVGRYRVRILEGARGRVLDIREWIESETFSGYTRRGIRLSDPAQVGLLRDVLSEALKAFAPAPPVKQ